MPFLITQSLLSSWQWYLSADEDNEEKAYFDLIKTLRREKLEDNESMLFGRVFESVVRLICDGDAWINEKDKADVLLKKKEFDDERLQKCVYEVAEECKGGVWQVKQSKIKNILGQDFLLYGRLDVLKGPWIIDIKFSHTFEIGKYRDSPQTKMYMHLVPDVIGMKYLISDGNQTYEDVYLRSSVESIDNDIKDFWSWISTQHALFYLYVKNWESIDA